MHVTRLRPPQVASFGAGSPVMSLTSLDGRLEAMGRLQPSLGPLLPKLDRFIREAPDTELDRINAILWAKEHGVDPHQALELFLRASAAGVFDLQWALMCPLCGLYVVFTVAAAVRKIEPRPLADIEQVRAHFVAEFHSRSLISNLLHEHVSGSMEISRWLPPGGATTLELYRAEGVGTDGMQLRSLAILFTDLTASTELYERVGDLKALDLVRRHFEVLQRVIAAERGAVVKTIGDAVMASFAEPDRALAAAAAMHRQMDQLGASEALTLKIGVHVGSCVAIESNQQLDFFGRTVNVAARVQAKAGAGDVVITKEVLDHAAAREVARSQFTS